MRQASVIVSKISYSPSWGAITLGGIGSPLAFYSLSNKAWKNRASKYFSMDPKDSLWETTAKRLRALKSEKLDDNESFLSYVLCNKVSINYTMSGLVSRLC